MLDGILQGLGTALLPVNLMMVVLGCFIGTFIGMLPGLGPVTAIALMIPSPWPGSGLRHHLDGGGLLWRHLRGSTSSILINAPGCSATVVTAFDGYPLACKGQAGKALAIAAYASLHRRHPLRHYADGGGAPARQGPLLPVGGLLPSWCWASPPWRPLPAGAGVLKALIMALFGIMIPPSASTAVSGRQVYLRPAGPA